MYDGRQTNKVCPAPALSRCVQVGGDRQVKFDTDAEIRYYTSSTPEAHFRPDLDALQRDITHWVPDPLQHFRGKRVLDLGAGRAPLGTMIAQQYAPHHVVSLELVLARLLTNDMTEIPPKLGLTCGNVFSLPFKDGAFDCIVANSFLHHLPDLRTAIAEIARVLKPTGMYFGREPNFDNPIVRFAVFGRDRLPIIPEQHTPNEYPLRAKQIREEFMHAGCACKLHPFWRRSTLR